MAREELTVFASTDAAFNALEAANPGITEALLGDRDLLRTVLLYHVLDGRVPAADVVQADTLNTLVDGADLLGPTDEGIVRINFAQVVAVDGQASNGIFHVIDGVLRPSDRCDEAGACEGRNVCDEGLCIEAPRPGNLVDELVADGRFGTLVQLVTRAGLAGAFGERRSHRLCPDGRRLPGPGRGQPRNHRCPSCGP